MVVVITRAVKENKVFKKKLETIGLKAFEYPCITISEAVLKTQEQQSISQIDNYDWIAFTSKKGVMYFMDYLKQQGIDTKVLIKKKIAAVGPQTANAIKKYHLPVHFIPSQFTTEHLAKEMKYIKGRRILLTRSNIASTLLTKALVAKGAHVTNIPVYKTDYSKMPTQELYKLVLDNKVSYITFTSPSTVVGFVNNVTNKTLLSKVLN